MSLQSLLDKELYQSYLRRLDARAVLEHYGARNCSEQGNQDGTTEIVHSCLLDRVEPHHTNGDQNPSASCNIDKKTYVCYSLGYGCDLFHLIMKLEGRESLQDSMGVIGQYLLGSTMETQAFRDELEKAFAPPQLHLLTLPTLSESVLDAWSAPHLYWNHRGISPQAQETLKLGYDPREKRIVFPHFQDGRLLGWQKRVVPGETFPDYPKYKNSPGFPKSETLYNHDVARHYRTAVVVESPMSVAKAVSLGIPNVVATFGAKISHFQVELLAKFDKVYIWFDRDGAGITGERKLVEALYRHTQTYVVTPDWGKDMGDAEHQDQILTKLDGAMPAALRLGQYTQLWKFEGARHGK